MVICKIVLKYLYWGYFYGGACIEVLVLGYLYLY